MITPVYTSPLQFAASITAEFVLANMAKLSSPSSLLDVGCGEGLIAAELNKCGADLFAIDGNEESISRSRAIGVNAKHCLLLDFDHSPFDLIFISRALHHMPPLVETLKKLETLIKPGGLLVIEDFGFELVDGSAAAWLIDQAKTIKEKTAVDTSRHKWLAAAGDLGPEEARQFWLEHHWIKHQLLTAAEMKKELTSQFKVESCQSSPYLFRYLCDLLPCTTDGAAQAWHVWQEETKLIATGQLPAVGLRMVLARK